MFLRQSFLFFTLCIVVPMSAMADRCVSGSEMGNAITIQDGENIISPHYAVHFDTAKFEVSEDCAYKVQEMFKKIKSQKEMGMLDGVLLLGSTDSVDSVANNLTLSRNRLNTVVGMLNDIGITNIHTKLYFSEIPWENDNREDWTKRAVYILFTDKVTTVSVCGNNVRSSLNSLEVKLNNHKGSDVSDAKNKLMDLKKFCSGGISNASQHDIDTYENKLTAFLNSLPVDANVANEDISVLKLQLKIAQIQAAYAGLVGEGSVWKTADGKFNYHRLIADSVAGVVLGTTGGLLSSHLIKKNQVKEGFEDLQCTIGGQVVANWGDQFLPTMTVAP